MATAPPSSSKETAEIALIQAQIAKLEHERRPAPLSAFSEVIKVVGSLILGLGGVTAAVTGYQMSEIKTERAELALERKQADLAALEQQYLQRKADFDKLGAELAALNETLAARQKEFAATAASVEHIRDQLVALREETSRRGQLSPETSQRLQAAIRDADQAKTATDKSKAEFEQTKAAVQRMSELQQRSLRDAPMKASK
jgi:DNA repair exonuclease SbcCD ATPase subunit